MFEGNRSSCRHGGNSVCFFFFFGREKGRMDKVSLLDSKEWIIE